MVVSGSQGMVRLYLVVCTVIGQKFRIPKFLTKWHMQIVQTQIRLLLQEQSDQGLHGLISTKYFKKHLCKKAKFRLN